MLGTGIRITYLAKVTRTSRRDYQVFVSHATTDKWIATTICKRLKARGVKTFRDDRDIQGGDDIPEQLIRNITQSKELVVLLTPDSAKRQWVALEVGAAWGRRPMSARERVLLAQIYRQLKVPTDQLARRPRALDQLTEEFNRTVGKKVSGTTILRELLQLRKRGRLPALGRRRAAESKALHVVRREGEWAVVSPGKSRAVSIHATQSAAVSAAREVAVPRSAEVVIHARDGRIVSRDSYGKASTPPRTRRH